MFDFEIIQRPGICNQAEDAVFRVPKTSVDTQSDGKDVGDNILARYIMEQESTACATIDNNHSTALTTPTPENSLTNQQTDSYCQLTLKSVQGSASSFKVNEDQLICRKASINDSLQLNVPEAF